jgi:hypothetical protein
METIPESFGTARMGDRVDVFDDMVSQQLCDWRQISSAVRQTGIRFA